MSKHPSQAAVARFEPRNASQRLAQRLYHQCDVLFLVGPAGCGKTLNAAGMAAVDVTSNSPRNRIVVLRPAVEAGEKLGFLPGTPAEKIQPYTAPVRQAISRVAFNFSADQISYEAVAYIRGLTYDHSVIVVDEAQNLTLPQLVLILTRLGRDSKIVITGDPDQCDIRGTSRTHLCDLDEVMDRLEGEERVGIVEFPDGESLRHPLVGRMLRRLTSRQ